MTRHMTRQMTRGGRGGSDVHRLHQRHRHSVRAWLVFIIIVLVCGLGTAATLVLCFCCPSCTYMSCMLYLNLCKRVCRFCYDVLCVRSDDPTDIYVQEHTYERL